MPAHVAALRQWLDTQLVEVLEEQMQGLPRDRTDAEVPFMSLQDWCQVSKEELQEELLRAIRRRRTPRAADSTDKACPFAARMPPKKQRQPAVGHGGRQSRNGDQPEETAARKIWSVRALHEPEPVRSMCGPTGHRMTATDEPILLGSSLIASRNLSNYWHAMASCSDEVFERLWNRCYIIEHCEGPTPPEVMTVRVDSHLLRNGRAHYTPTTKCEQLPCQRCEQGRGGFRFPWCGCWTTDNCIGHRLIFEAELAVALASVVHGAPLKLEH